MPSQTTHVLNSTESILLLLVVLTFDGKEPPKTQHDMNNVRNKDHELFTNQYLAFADTIRSDCLNEQLSLHALSKLEISNLKFSNIIGTLNTY